ncbi:MAG: right-handed parallel beta-helix repeat-containing protein, partial [Actinomycetota bacterium]|nr:right-handed parallel beta-helix repeat-containing protein [Actinomycetota bacterium]
MTTSLPSGVPRPRVQVVLVGLSLSLLLAVPGQHAASAATVINVNEFAESATFSDHKHPPAAGATILDVSNHNGKCSLREAVEAVNTHLAVDGCPAGTGDDRIVLPPGEYGVEAPLALTAMATVSGANTGTDGRSATRGPETIVKFVSNPSPDFPAALFQLTGAGAGSVFDGLALRGQLNPDDPHEPVYGIDSYVAAPVRGFTVRNSTFKDFTCALCDLGGSDMLVERNDFLGELVGGDPNSGVFGNAIYGDFPASNLVVQDSRFAGYSNADVIEATATTSLTGFTVRRNTMRDDSGLAVLTRGANQVSITDNWITADPVTPGVRGIIISDANVGVDVSHNTITNQTSGLRVRKDVDASPSSVDVHVHGNRVYGNAEAINISAGSLPLSLDATGNWWGANAGIGGVGGTGQRVNGITGPASLVDASSPLQLAVPCPAQGVIGTPAPLTAGVAGMPTALTALAHFGANWPGAAAPADPIYTGTAAGGSVAGFPSYVTGSSSPVIGGTVAG